MITHKVNYPKRDVNRRKLCGLMLGFSKKDCFEKYTVEELEKLCVEAGYLEIVEEKRGKTL